MGTWLPRSTWVQGERFFHTCTAVEGIKHDGHNHPQTAGWNPGQRGPRVQTAWPAHAQEPTTALDSPPPATCPHGVQVGADQPDTAKAPGKRIVKVCVRLVRLSNVPQPRPAARRWQFSSCKSAAACYAGMHAMAGMHRCCVRPHNSASWPCQARRAG